MFCLVFMNPLGVRVRRPYMFVFPYRLIQIREHLFEQVAELYHTLDQGITPLSFFFPNAPIPAHL